MQKIEFEVNNDINSKVSLCEGDITKFHIDAIVISENKALIIGGVVDIAIPEAARPRLLDECQKLNG